MAKIFKAAERRFEQGPGRKEGFRLASDAAITAGMAAARDTETGGAPSGTCTGPQDVLGRGSLNFDVRRLPPGELSSLYHVHRHAEELFMITEGEATLRTPDGLHVLEAGDIAFFGTGAEGAHQLYNHSDEPCVYLDVRTFTGADIAEYPDSGRLLVVPTMERFDKSQSTGYFEGEPSAARLRKKFKQQK
jgi:uncharacterized cupin superfamily protein